MKRSVSRFSFKGTAFVSKNAIHNHKYVFEAIPYFVKIADGKSFYMSNTLFIGKVYYRFDELPSTNDWAAEFIASRQKEAAKTRPPEGMVVRAANQTAGKGQLGSLWQSQPGENLLISIVLYPTWLTVSDQFYLSMAVALALRDVVVRAIKAEDLHGLAERDKRSSEFQLTTSRIKIKWPNDLYIGDQKTAGILIQNTIAGSGLQSSIVGFGLNINQLNFPPELPNATSLARSVGVVYDIDDIADRFFECLEKRYLQLKSGEKKAVKAEYEAHLWRRGITTTFIRQATGATFEGTIQGVNERGELLIQTDTETATFEVKEVSVVV
jgi:BirA family biotin operon repressor/biotin-[acetyl-CoA-carboxylase] ligase